MRKASVAIVPLLLAVMALFWFIWFMGGANDNLHKVNEIENLQHLQARLLPAAMKRYIEYKEADDVPWTDSNEKAEIEKCINQYIQTIMKGNKIDDDVTATCMQ